ncbi:MerC domain-containing protein [Xanthovirga aplysinae]|uniref:MerC domain-containing protein n=1 Tax=Xanthovirga aplysinae TaxID=2529853 RepID=UPI0012BB8F92|nr:MerC domain-containing protein [Xanthovirga aplysinae]MTI29569.1 MerC domain-containing protein [Xanthovirga aplysinae]
MVFSQRSDEFGAVTSGLCFVHCLVTPFLFVVQASYSIHDEATPLWWSSIDFLFLGISFLAVYWSARKTSKQWIKYAFVLSFIFLAFVILNEKFEGFHLVEEIIYLPALSLIFLHIYNKKYCQCKKDECCVVEKY